VDDQAGWCTSIIPALGRLKKEDQEFQVRGQCWSAGLACTSPWVQSLAPKKKKEEEEEEEEKEEEDIVTQE
jgi:hypothetical protein